MLSTHEMLRNQVTNLLNKANSLKDSYSFEGKKIICGTGRLGKWDLLGLSPQTWQLKRALAIESDSGRDGDIQSHPCTSLTALGTSQAFA